WTCSIVVRFNTTVLIGERKTHSAASEISSVDHQSRGRSACRYLAGDGGQQAGKLRIGAVHVYIFRIHFCRDLVAKHYADRARESEPFVLSSAEALGVAIGARGIIVIGMIEER